jgi:ribonuclease BN (tRNA processing enzyme)
VISVTFHGVRGSTPCNAADIARYGGNTSCVSLAMPGHDPVLFDMGTGIRYFGLQQPLDGSFRGHILLSHLHWDHTQGLPFFTPVLCSGSRLDIYGPAQEDGRSVADVLHSTIRPPLFPIVMEELPGKIDCHDVSDTDFVLDSARDTADVATVATDVDEIAVKARLIPHVGPTCGYRVAWGGRSVTYISDHQMPYDGSMSASESALELVDGCDLLIHDSQYTTTEFERKSTWGHCTMEYAVWLAAEAGAKRLALFHHDPLRRDEWLDELAKGATELGERRGVEVFAAAEGLTITL